MSPPTKKDTLSHYKCQPKGGQGSGVDWKAFLQRVSVIVAAENVNS